MRTVHIATLASVVFLALLVGPQQVSRDLANNGLPLYLCRPFTRSEYVVGKMSIVVILLSTITWMVTASTPVPSASRPV